MSRASVLLTAIASFAATVLLLWPASSFAQTAAKENGNGSVLKVGSKLFPESEIIAELVTQLAVVEGQPARHRPIGSTQIIWGALRQGEIDLYPDYTGTIAKEILQDETLADDEAIRAALAKQGIIMSPPLGFANPYAIGMSAARADELGIRTISDLQAHPDLKLAFSTEFLERSDGWPGLRTRYRLAQKQPLVMEHALAYPAVADGEIDATDVYVTDSNITKLDFRLLEDDKHFFPQYNAVLLYRADAAQRLPKLAAILARLEGKIGVDDIRQMNEQVQEYDLPAGQVAGEFLQDKFDV